MTLAHSLALQSPNLPRTPHTGTSAAVGARTFAQALVLQFTRARTYAPPTSAKRSTRLPAPSAAHPTPRRPSNQPRRPSRAVSRPQHPRAERSRTSLCSARAPDQRRRRYRARLGRGADSEGKRPPALPSGLCYPALHLLEPGIWPTRICDVCLGSWFETQAPGVGPGPPARRSEPRRRRMATDMRPRL